MFGSRLNAESDLQLIMLSEKFQHCLLVMERSIMGNIFQSELAAYRQLPVLEGKLSSSDTLLFTLEALTQISPWNPVCTTMSDPDSLLKPGATEQRTEDTESCRSPALERLWVFSCELSRGRSVSSMAWNKNNPVTGSNLNHCHLVFFLLI